MPEGPAWLPLPLPAAAACSALSCPARLTHRLGPGSSRRRLGPELAQVGAPRISLSGAGGADGRAAHPIESWGRWSGPIARGGGTRRAWLAGVRRDGGRPCPGPPRPRSRPPFAGRSATRRGAGEVASGAAAQLLGTRGGGRTAAALGGGGSAGRSPQLGRPWA